MRKIYSRLKPSFLLHIVNKRADISEKREDVCPDESYLQVACFSANNGKTFKPHKHIENIRKTNITQESWIVISGSVKAILYDIDDTVICEEILMPGDCSITFHGGHNYVILEDNTVVYEYKTGPYFGQAKDKVIIGE